MARYVTTVRSSLTQEEAFAYIADFRNLPEWDRGVRRVDQVNGDGPGAGCVYDVVVNGLAGRSSIFRYETTSYSPSRSFVMEASNRLFTSVDRVDVTPDGEGSLVRYDARLTLNGPLGVFDIALRPVFDKIGDRANTGLLRALDAHQA